ncbi:hypothetical protein DL765_009303 [Monosporascus sp. GIB2]|nr:hypothetical protein DL765_009303 [Monosporascus sp. GIB2]
MSTTYSSRDTHAGHSEQLEQKPLDANQHGQAAGGALSSAGNSNIIAETTDSYGTKRPDADLGASMEAHAEKVKDQVDDAVAKGPKRADAHSGGRVLVGETGDLHDLAARKQP